MAIAIPCTRRGLSMDASDMIDLAHKRVMVTGGTSPLGGIVVEKLARRGCAEVFVPHPVEFDLRRASDITRALSAFEPEVVFHLAVADGGADRDEPGRCLYENAIAGIELIEQSRRMGVEKIVCVGGVGGVAGAAEQMLLSLLRAYRLQYGMSGILLLPASPQEPHDGFDLSAAAEEIVLAAERFDDPDPLSLDAGPAMTTRDPAAAAAGAGAKVATVPPEPYLPPVEEIRDGEQVIAIIVRGSLRKPGVSFFSEADFSQQLGFILQPAGHIIEPHVHNAVPRQVVYTQETLVVREGRMRVDLYRDDRTLLTSRVLTGGDAILLATGGHGFEMLDETSMIEVKQGPYSGDSDKTRFGAQ